MRAIEKKIINCLKNSDFLGNSVEGGKSESLSPRDSIAWVKNQKRIYLWNSCIFTLDKENNVKFSFRGWQTNTTKNRINALLSAFCNGTVTIYQKNYGLIFSSSAGEFPIDSAKIYAVRNGKPEEVEII